MNANFITDDTDWLNARAGSEGTLLSVRLANETKAFEKAKLTPDQKRKMDFLRAGIVMPAPSTGTPEEQKAIADELNDDHHPPAVDLRQGQVHRSTASDARPRRTLQQSSSECARSEEAAAGLGRLAHRLRSGRRATREGGSHRRRMKPDYARMVEIGNDGARGARLQGHRRHVAVELRHALRPTWRRQSSGCGRRSQPLYEDLHCYVRGRLNAKYGDAVQPKTGPIRADLLGNMWAQDWTNIYPLVAPAGVRPGL